VRAMQAGDLRDVSMYWRRETYEKRSHAPEKSLLGCWLCRRRKRETTQAVREIPQSPGGGQARRKAIKGSNDCNHAQTMRYGQGGGTRDFGPRRDSLAAPPLRGCVSAGEGFKGAGTVQWAEYPRRDEHCAKAPIPIRDVDQTPDFQTLGLAFHLLSIVGKEL